MQLPAVKRETTASSSRSQPTTAAHNGAQPLASQHRGGQQQSAGGRKRGAPSTVSSCSSMQSSSSTKTSSSGGSNQDPNFMLEINNIKAQSKPVEMTNAGGGREGQPPTLTAAADGNQQQQLPSPFPLSPQQLASMFSFSPQQLVMMLAQLQYAPNNGFNGCTNGSSPKQCPNSVATPSVSSAQSASAKSARSSPPSTGGGAHVQQQTPIMPNQQQQQQRSPSQQQVPISAHFLPQTPFMFCSPVGSPPMVSPNAQVNVAAALHQLIVQQQQNLQLQQFLRLVAQSQDPQILNKLTDPQIFNSLQLLMQLAKGQQQQQSAAGQQMNVPPAAEQQQQRQYQSKGGEEAKAQQQVATKWKEKGKSSPTDSEKMMSTKMSVKRRSSCHSQGSNTSQGTITLSNLSTNSNQPASNGSSKTISSIRQLSIEEAAKHSLEMRQMDSNSNQVRQSTPKQKKKESGGKGHRVPKKTRRMSVDAAAAEESCSPGAGGVNGTQQEQMKTEYLAETLIPNGGIEAMDQQAQSNYSPSASGSSSSPSGTVASPNNLMESGYYMCRWAGCKESFEQHDAFVDHVTTHVKAEQAPQFFCRWMVCQRNEPFNAQYMLAQHVRKHSGEKPYECLYEYPNGKKCNKRYSRLENLKTHERTHTGDRPYQCAHCVKTFTNASDKAKHQNRTHKDEKDYGCPVFKCPKRYTDPSSLRKHVFHEHGAQVWNFAKEHKEKTKAKDYGVIGIAEDGTPYAMPNLPSSDSDREVDVMSTTPPPPPTITSANNSSRRVGRKAKEDKGNGPIGPFVGMVMNGSSELHPLVAQQMAGQQHVPAQLKQQMGSPTTALPSVNQQQTTTFLPNGQAVGLQQPTDEHKIAQFHRKIDQQMSRKHSVNLPQQGGQFWQKEIHRQTGGVRSVTNGDYPSPIHGPQRPLSLGQPLIPLDLCQHSSTMNCLPSVGPPNSAIFPANNYHHPQMELRNGSNMQTPSPEDPKHYPFSSATAGSPYCGGGMLIGTKWENNSPLVGYDLSVGQQQAVELMCPVQAQQHLAYSKGLYDPDLVGQRTGNNANAFIPVHRAPEISAVGNPAIGAVAVCAHQPTPPNFALPSQIPTPIGCQMQPRANGCPQQQQQQYSSTQQLQQQQQMMMVYTQSQPQQPHEQRPFCQNAGPRNIGIEATQQQQRQQQLVQQFYGSQPMANYHQQQGQQTQHQHHHQSSPMANAHQNCNGYGNGIAGVIQSQQPYGHSHEQPRMGQYGHRNQQLPQLTLPAQPPSAGLPQTPMAQQLPSVMAPQQHQQQVILQLEMPQGMNATQQPLADDVDSVSSSISDLSKLSINRS